MIGRMARTIYFVTDLDRAKRFYQEVLGLELVSEEEGFVELLCDGGRIALHVAKKVAPGRTKVAFHVRSVAVARRQLEKRGAKMGKILEGKGIKICDGRDPDGNVFQVTSRA